MARLLPVALVLFSILSYSHAQISMSVPTPRIGAAIALANELFHDESLDGPSVRTECRLLSRSELERLLSAFRRAHQDTSIQPNVLDAFAFLHTHPEVSVGAHGGTNFLPWHRVYMYLFEKLLRRYEPRVSLCFWDNTLEPEDFEDSESWSSDLFGTGRGLVTTGFAANWITPIGPLIREVASTGRTLNEEDLENVLSKERLGEISFPNGNMRENFEELHNHVHLYVGGFMSQLETASYDPLFWFLHSYIDCFYEEFRQKQNSTGLVNHERDWPVDYGEPDHAPFGSMRLGALRNIDGQNDFFSRRLTCEKVPKCRRDRDCGRYMNCDSRRQRCVSNTARSRNNNVFGGMFGMGSNSFGGMFQNGMFNMQGSGSGFTGMMNQQQNIRNPFAQAMRGMFGMSGTGVSQSGRSSAGMQNGFQGMSNFAGGLGFPGRGQSNFPGMTSRFGMGGFPGMSSGGSQGFQGMQGTQFRQFGGQQQGMPRGFPSFGK